ncbi:hypothetical protein NL676_030050 [Syzygium grande]|nr:hypothetical protein NL676_030050 [Syzygium grande]
MDPQCPNENLVSPKASPEGSSGSGAKPIVWEVDEPNPMDEEPGNWDSDPEPMEPDEELEPIGEDPEPEGEPEEMDYEEERR